MAKQEINVAILDDNVWADSLSRKRNCCKIWRVEASGWLLMGLACS